MAQNFLACDREQVVLVAADVRDGCRESHLAWFVIDAVGGDGSRRVYAPIGMTGTAARRTSRR